MDDFRNLISVVVFAGIVSGLALAAVQQVAVRPLITIAEELEAVSHVGHHGAVADEDGTGEWTPADGAERLGFTVLGTVLTGIAYAALLFGVASLLSLSVDARRGLLLGLGGFACFALAPALGLPPKPPGVAGAELVAAQMWWASTALATATGLVLFARAGRRWSWWVIGAVVVVAPHVVGAPQAPRPDTEALRELGTRFAATSVATQAVFWVILGAVGGYLYARAFAPGSLIGREP